MKLTLLALLAVLCLSNPLWAQKDPLHPFQGETPVFQEVQEQLQSKGLLGKIRQKLLTLVGGTLTTFESFTVSGATFGLKEGIVTEVILGIGRSVEKNPSPTGPHDVYLVKDTLKIGLRLGLGVVLSGNVAYIHQFTLVYPAKDRVSGILTHGFVLDFLLPFRVIRHKLPQRYVLMRESFIEGQGRLRISGGKVPLGMDVTLSRVKMGRTILSQKEAGKAQLFVDDSHYNELGLYIGFQFGLIDIPIQTAAAQWGQLSRYQLTLNLEKESNQLAFNDILQANNIKRALSHGSKTLIETDFIHRYRYFTLLGFFTSKSIERTDRITETDYSSDQQLLRQVERFQIENRKRTSYSLLIGSEAHMSQIFLTARPSEEGGLLEPLLTLTLLARDRSVRKSEIYETFPDLFNQLVNQKDVLKIPEKLTEQKHLAKEAQLLIHASFYPEAVFHLLEFNPQILWKRLVKSQGRGLPYWKRAAKTSYQDRRNKRMRNNRIPLNHLVLAKQLKKLIGDLEKAQAQPDPFLKVRTLTRALRKGIYYTPDTFNLIIPSLIIKELGPEKVFIDGEFVQFKKLKHIGPEKDLIIKCRWGQKQNMSHPHHRFFFEDAHELYHLFI